MSAVESPNKDIDKAIKKLMSRLDDKEDPVPLDMAVKVINSSIQWEKVKHAILDNGDAFNPDEL